MVLTDEQQTDAYPVASMETAQAAVENTYYSKIEETRSAKPPGYPDDTYTNPNDFVSKLNGDGNKIGTGIVLKVMSGDAVNIRATSWYKLNGASPGTPVNPLNDLVVAMSRGISAVATDYGKITITELQSNGVLTPGIGSLLSQQDASYTENTRPKAYLNWILLDEQFKLVSSSSGFEQVGDDNEFKTWVKTGLPINRNGYLYVYTSNESPVDVFFDNLQVTHVRGPLQEETHYYPFGLTMAGISSKAAGKLENRFKYNGGSELQHQEFSDGSGLELYDTHFRQLDPQLGRWWQVDPKPNYDESPYASMGNNPILHNDILGDTLQLNNSKATFAFTLGFSFGLDMKIGKTPLSAGIEVNAGKIDLAGIRDNDPVGGGYNFNSKTASYTKSVGGNIAGFGKTKQLEVTTDELGKKNSKLTIETATLGSSEVKDVNTGKKEEYIQFGLKVDFILGFEMSVKIPVVHNKSNIVLPIDPNNGKAAKDNTYIAPKPLKELK